MLRLDIGSPDPQAASEIRTRLKNFYERVAGSDDYERNQRSLRLIEICVITLSAAATGFVNAFSHRERLGWIGAGILALLITAFVEKFYFTLRHGLTTIYQSRKQRLVAALCYRAIQGTMTANAAVLCGWVVGVPLPRGLEAWSRHSLIIHFALALIGVSAVRDADAVVEDRIRKLKAEAALEDLAAIRLAAAADNPLLPLAARIRGWCDGIAQAKRLLRDKPGCSTGGVKRIADTTSRLYLPSGAEGNTQEDNVTDISGKHRRR